MVNLSCSKAHPASPNQKAIASVGWLVEAKAKGGLTSFKPTFGNTVGNTLVPRGATARFASKGFSKAVAEGASTTCAIVTGACLEEVWVNPAQAVISSDRVIGMTALSLSKG